MVVFSIFPACSVLPSHSLYPVTRRIAMIRLSQLGMSVVDDHASDGPPPALLSDEPTMELLLRAQGGDRGAVEALLQRSLPSLRRWAHGRLPTAARGYLDTEDLVQESALHALRRLDYFEPRHVGA